MRQSVNSDSNIIFLIYSFSIILPYIYNNGINFSHWSEDNVSAIASVISTLNGNICSYLLIEFNCFMNDYCGYLVKYVDY